jgi:hypothetical protein
VGVNEVGMFTAVLERVSVELVRLHCDFMHRLTTAPSRYRTINFSIPQQPRHFPFVPVNMSNKDGMSRCRLLTLRNVILAVLGTKFESFLSWA